MAELLNTLQKRHMGRAECHRIRCRHSARPCYTDPRKRKGGQTMAVLGVKNLKKIYRPRFGGNQVQARSRVNFSVEEGEEVASMGERGSGKTTVLDTRGGLGKTCERCR